MTLNIEFLKILIPYNINKFKILVFFHDITYIVMKISNIKLNKLKIASQT